MFTFLYNYKTHVFAPDLLLCFIPSFVLDWKKVLQTLSVYNGRLFYSFPILEYNFEYPHVTNACMHIGCCTVILVFTIILSINRLSHIL